MRWLLRLFRRRSNWTPAENPLRDGMTPEAEARLEELIRRARPEDGEIRVYS